MKKISETVKANALCNPKEKILVGVSGGPDSMTLLHVLLELRKTWGIRLHVAHVNHGLRPEARKDQTFVKKFSEEKGIPFSTTTLKLSRKKGRSSIEDLAREQRLKFLFQTAKRNKIKTIALGHTQDDLAETVMMRILRGTGLHGLQAILPKRTFKGLTIIRPLINVSRREIMSYLKTHKIPYRTDRSNYKTVFFRNKVRLDLIPHLQKYNPNIKQILANLAANTAIDYDFLNAAGTKYYKQVAVKASSKSVTLNVNRLKALHPSIRRLSLRQAVESLSSGPIPLTTEHILIIEQLLRQNSSRAIIILPGNKIRVCRDESHLTVSKRK